MSIMRLGAAYPGPTPVYDYYGNLVDPSTPATAADCLPFVCGAQSSNTAAKFWCAYWGQAANYAGCLDPRCAPFRPSYCVPSSGAPVAPAVSRPAAAAAAPAAAPSSTPASGPDLSPVLASPARGRPGGGGATQPATVPDGSTTVLTPSGPITVPAAVVPSASGPLTPAQIRIPSIWDSLDPSKLSQFEYRGLSLSLPSWISAAYRNSLAPATASTTGVMALDLSAVPGWVWILILGALFLLSNGKARRQRRS
jgi:hypothetical protein